MYHARYNCLICDKEKCESWMEYSNAEMHLDNGEGAYICKKHCTYYDVNCTCGPNVYPQYLFFTWEDADGREHYDEIDAEWSKCSRCPRGICYRCSYEQWEDFFCPKCSEIFVREWTFSSKAYAQLCGICYQECDTPKCGVCNTEMVSSGSDDVEMN